MPETDRADFRPPRESALWIVVLLVIAGLAAGAWWWRVQRPSPAEPPTVAAPAAPPDGSPPAAPPVASAPTGPQFPVETPPDKPLPALADSDAQVRAALDGLLGGKAVASFLQLDGFVRRFVATVDGLPREQASARLWPVQRAPDRFAVAGAGPAEGPKTIGPDNGARYTPFVLFAESVDPARAVALYVKLYPLFQQAYEELGYPGRYFNDRLVAVIDHLLQAPEPAGPLQVKLTEVKGEFASEPPWLRYEFADPKLQSLSAGQKLLVRVGLVNERRLKVRLTELRRQLVAAAPARK